MSGHRALAAAVILRAIKDTHGAAGPGLTKSVRRGHYESARAFLDPGNADFRLYCDALDLDPVALYEAIRRRGRNLVALAGRGLEASAVEA